MAVKRGMNKALNVLGATDLSENLFGRDYDTTLLRGRVPHRSLGGPRTTISNDESIYDPLIFDLGMLGTVRSFIDFACCAAACDEGGDGAQ